MNQTPMPDEPVPAAESEELRQTKEQAHEYGEHLKAQLGRAKEWKQRAEKAEQTIRSQEQTIATLLAERKTVADLTKERDQLLNALKESALEGGKHAGLSALRLQRADCAEADLAALTAERDEAKKRADDALISRDYYAVERDAARWARTVEIDAHKAIVEKFERQLATLTTERDEALSKIDQLSEAVRICFRACNIFGAETTAAQAKIKELESQPRVVPTTRESKPLSREPDDSALI